MGRRKPVPAVLVNSLDDADKVLEELAALERQASAITNTMNETIDSAKAKAADEMAVVAARKKLLEAALASYATMNKAELFKVKKSVELNFGILSFRLSSKVVPAGKSVNWGMILDKIKDHKFTEAISIKESVNKEVLAKWDDKKLEKVGAKIKTEDTFGYDLKQQDAAHTKAA